MFFLLREVAGWLLVLVSLYLLRESYLFLQSRQVIEAGVLSMAAIGVFPGRNLSDSRVNSSPDLPEGAAANSGERIGFLIELNRKTAI